MRRRRLPALLISLLAAGPIAADDYLAERLSNAAPDADPKVLSLAARAVSCAHRKGLLERLEHLAVIDYSRPSTKPRLWVFDAAAGRLMYEELVAHGRNTGEHFAKKFSNIEGSKMSSLGLFRTANTYYGSNGYSLRLNGLEQGFNDKAMSRAIVMHGAPYVSKEAVKRFGRLGRSWGCPAVRQEVAREVIDTLKGGNVVFAYYPDQKWLTESSFLSCERQAPSQVAANTPAVESPTG